MLETAIKYSERGFSVIPVKPDKKPHILWKSWQGRRADGEQIREWWSKHPAANVAIVTGKISEIVVVDVDTEEAHAEIKAALPPDLITPTARSPRGGYHYYFAYQEGLSNRANVFSGCDIRTDGGYIIAPPSVGENGTAYSWGRGRSIFEIEPVPLPNDFFKKIYNKDKNINSNKKVEVTQTKKNAAEFKKGSRDEDIFHLANTLVKGGMDDVTIKKYIRFFAKNCSPPFPHDEALAKIESAKKRNSRLGIGIAEEVRDFVMTSEGYFLTSDVYTRLQLTSRTDKKAVVNELLRLKEKGIVERNPKKDGVYRRIEHDCEKIDFLNAETETVDLWLPFNLQDTVEIMPGNIIVIAGEPNAGKTALLLNIVKNNMKNFEIHYFSSEMGGSEMRKRLSKFDDIELQDWKFHPWERADNFADVIKSGKKKLNIIDFLEIHEDFYRVGGMLTEIHKKLHGGIAVVALQKNKGVELGLGAYRSLEKPRLYLAMESGKLKIVKAKNWKGYSNPNGWEIEFRIVDGAKFIKDSEWR